MPATWVIIGVGLGYLGLLFVIAWWGDRSTARARETGATPWFLRPRVRPALYALALAVYCTSWTLYGSVGLASRDGWSFLAIYLGPIAFFTLGAPLLARVIRLAKAHNISSAADFIAARHGKSQRVAAAVAVIALLGTIPYIALQLKAVSDSLALLTGLADAGALSLGVALLLTLFAGLFGTRDIDATEHQNGLMLAVAAESIVKLAAFLLVGAFITFGLFDGPLALWAEAEAAGATAPFKRPPPLDLGLTMVGLAFVCALLLPRQFHVGVVESHGEEDLRLASRLFPAYLIAINVFVVPIALAGLITFDQGAPTPSAIVAPGSAAASGDLFVLALPAQADAPVMTLIAFIGGLSAATAMVIVAGVALAIMLSNDIVTPLALRVRGARRAGADLERGRLGRAETVLASRRAAILVVMLMAYGYERLAGDDAALASIGLISFAAIAQLAPVFFGGLFWRGGTARGALAGMAAGILTWAYTLLLPTFARGGLLDDAFLVDGLFGLDALRPQALFGLDLDPLAHSVVWSLGVNLLVYLAVSRAMRQSAIERVQAALFVPRRAPRAPHRTPTDITVTVGELQDLVTGFLGRVRTEDVFSAFKVEGGDKRSAGSPPRRRHRATPELLNEAERLLATAVGAASSRALLSILLMKGDVPRDAALRLLDEASAGLQESRGTLQTALDQVSQGIAVFDPDLRLRAWNRRFVGLLNMPDALARPGTPLMAVLRHNAEHGQYGHGNVPARVRERMEQIVVRASTLQERRTDTGAVLEVRTASLPQGGLVATYTDVTEKVEAAERLAAANAGLEERVRVRTREFEDANRALEAANRALGEAKANAEAADRGKTRFLAAASHDLMQPLSAARLYANGLADASATSGEREAWRTGSLAAKIDASLGAVEEILVTLIDISRLDAGALKPVVAPVAASELLEQIETEFAPTAERKGLTLTVRGGRDRVLLTDRRLLLRLLRNVVSNALKYTRTGGVLVGVRDRGADAAIEVFDTGTGIPEDEREAVFQEFLRLEDGARMSEGLGLGLSIVRRIASVLHHPLELSSRVGRGTRIAVTVPLTTLEETVPAPARPFDPGLGGLKALCVDNEPDILAGMRALLEGWGCEVRTAEDRASGLAAVSGWRPDVLLLDYHLPRDDGISIARALRDATGPEEGRGGETQDEAVPGILITAERGDAIEEAVRENDLGLLHKPLKPARLRALLATLNA